MVAPFSVCAKLRVGHALTVTETGLAFLQDARRRGELCWPLDWIPEVYHPIGSGEAVIPDALLYYRRGREGGEGAMLRAFVEVDRATLAAPLVDLLHGGPSEPVWRPVRDPGSTVGWSQPPSLGTPRAAPARPGAAAADHPDHRPDHDWSQRRAAS
ncbi:replication-relaxation family protein [Streptomyces sp. NPDC087437]|uniref:replication-relaxation family protein n=1 Tax=Streptomyces sp. NPDC087437 TaxID=3365789 RepID=UPI00382D7B14